MWHHSFVPLPSELEPYNKLCEVGTCLYQAKQFQLCIQVLTAAQQLETNQQGITMKLLLTLANAHSHTNNQELAVSIYQVGTCYVSLKVEFPGYVRFSPISNPCKLTAQTHRWV